MTHLPPTQLSVKPRYNVAKRNARGAMQEWTVQLGDHLLFNAKGTTKWAESRLIIELTFAFDLDVAEIPDLIKKRLGIGERGVVAFATKRVRIPDPAARPDESKLMAKEARTTIAGWADGIAALIVTNGPGTNDLSEPAKEGIRYRLASRLFNNACTIAELKYGARFKDSLAEARESLAR